MIVPQTETTKDMVHEAFRAGWMTDAIPPDEHKAGPDYVHGCEEVDWQEWISKHGKTP